MHQDNIALLNETLDILQQGSYSVNGKKVQLKLSPAQMQSAVVLLPEEVADIREHSSYDGPYVLGRCGYGIENADSYTAARKQYVDYSYMFMKDSKEVLVLNFANPVHPGGGVRRGAKAQEEDLCRKSSLLFSLESSQALPYYEYHRGRHTYLASDAMILSPKVEIIRDERGNLLEDTVLAAVLTCAAPMVSHGKEGMTDAAYEALLYQRILGMFHAAVKFGYQHLVLGAWGCGAFGNDAEVMSDLFYKALKNLNCNGRREKDLFRRIDFAVLDRTGNQYNYRAFERNFAHFYRDEEEKERQNVLKRMKEKEVNLDRIRGSLYGGAVGDALGYPVEFLSLDRIHSLYGVKGIQAYSLDHRSGKALISDDTQMTLFTADGILTGDTRGCLRGIQGAPSGYVYRAYLDWLKTQTGKEMKSKISWLLDIPELHSRRAPGNTCLSALESGIQGTTKKPVNNSKGCGGIMRVAPLALRYGTVAIETLDQEGAEIAAITHGHSLGYMPAAVLVHIIRRAVYDRKNYQNLGEIVEESKQTISKLFAGDMHLEYLIRLMDEAVSLAYNDKSDEENIRKLGEGWVAEETLAIAIYCSLRYTGDFSKGIIAAVNHDGDSDSTGAVTGNILGAWLGYDAIGAQWKQNLELSDVILEMADDLCHGCMMSEYSSYRDKAWEQKYIYHKAYKEYDLSRFLKAQQSDYAAALAEIKRGRKESHWMWYIFPQIAGLGRSPVAQFYSIRDRGEAEAYLNDPVLGKRLVEISEALLALDSDNAEAIFGWPDVMKLCSCMTLFDTVGENKIFQKVLDKYYDGRRDEKTLEILSQNNLFI